MSFNMEEYLKKQNKNNPFEEVDVNGNNRREIFWGAGLMGYILLVASLTAYMINKSPEYQRERFDAPKTHRFLQ